MVEGYVMDCEGICGRQSHSLRATLLSQAKKFVERFHEERRNKLGLILDNERWKQADVPAEFQTLVNSLIDGINPRGKDPKFSLDQSSKEIKVSTSTVLIINGEKFVVVGTVLLLLKMIVEYCQCVDDTPMLVTDIMNKLFEILKLFNSRTCQLVLGAGALQLVGLKTITVKHLALASRCLQVIALHLPVFKAHFEGRLPPKQYILLSQFDQIQKDYTNHQLELNSKIIGLMEEAFNTSLSRWEVKPPMPSQAMRSIVKQVVKLHESLSTVFSQEQIETLFKEIRRIFKNCLAEKLLKLNVINDGGPQHGLVTSDLAFLIESVRSLHGLRDISKVLEDLWRTVNDLKAARNSPSTTRKKSQQK
ncbi:Vacuolar protein sorting-associated protein 54 [Exaiptasia diaphana]|nr:Vacuolar protein sorting-associated protein 54 [Exaiptasia diaphana]